MKKILSVVLMLAMLLLLCSCDRYVSSYKAVGLVRINDSHSCEVSFYSLEGQLVYKLKKSQSGAEGDISYSLEVEEGEVTVYYDIYDVKEELAHASAGETTQGRGGYVEGGHTVYIIIEAKAGARGKVTVELDNQE